MRTLAGPCSFEVEVRRSRFVAHAGRVDTQAAAMEFLESVAAPDATHNCWAWKLDRQYRFNDDGEPSGTAGRPILAAIDGNGLDHVMIVVTRYFGGIKLGAGGLVRAYSGAAARCIDRARIAEIEPRIECDIQADFCWTGQLYAALEACEAEKIEEHFADGGITIRAAIRTSGLAGLKAMLDDMTRGEARVRQAG